MTEQDFGKLSNILNKLPKSDIKVIKILSNTFWHFNNIIGPKIYISLLLGFGAVISESFGIAIIIPLLSKFFNAGEEFVLNSAVNQVLLFLNFPLEDTTILLICVIAVFFLKSILQFSNLTFNAYFKSIVLKRHSKWTISLGDRA